MIYHASMTEPSEIQTLIAQLNAKGWTYSAIADELGSDYRTLWQWRTGRFTPAHSKAIALALRHLLVRKRIPKKKRYSKEALDTWQQEGRYSESRAKGNSDDGVDTTPS